MWLMSDIESLVFVAIVALDGAAGRRSVMAALFPPLANSHTRASVLRHSPNFLA